MKGILVYKDGRRVDLEPEYLGGIRHHRCSRGPNGEMLETIFEASNDESEGRDVVLYIEGETIDVTKRFIESEKRIRENTYRIFRKGMGFDS